MSGRTQLERAIIQIKDKGPVPEIDFTQHQLENGYTVSTQERVVKDVRRREIVAFRYLTTLWTLLPVRRDRCKHLR